MRKSGFSYPARHTAKKRIFLVLLIAAVVAAGFFLRKNPYKYPYFWSQTSPEAMTFEKARTYCDNLEEGGFDDWRLPELHEIKSVAELCVEEENSDFCAVTDSCEWDGCETELCGRCVKYENFAFGSFWTNTRIPGGKISLWAITQEEEKTDKFSLPSELHKTKCIRNK